MHLQKSKLDDLRIHGRESAPRGFGPGLGLVVILVLMLAGGFAGYRWLKRSYVLEVRTVAAKQVANSTGQRTVLNASGYVTARRAATVSSKVTGKVMELFVEEGKRVEQGQVLAHLDDTNVKASLRLAEARLASATNALEETRVRIKEADRELRRQTDLTASKIATQADYDRAEAAAMALKARLQQQGSDVVVAEREVAAWQQQLDDTIIRAPFSGIVTSKNAQPGEMISPVSAGGGFTRTGICTIVDMDSLEIEIDVNESYINRVEPQQAVVAALDSYPDWKIPCKVIAIIPTADRQKSTVKVRVGFDKLDPRILPEMSAKVSFLSQEMPEGERTARTVLQPAAIVQRDGKSVVFVIKGDKVAQVAIETGAKIGEMVEIKSGVAAGDRVVMRPPEKLHDGAAIALSAK